MNLVTRGSSYGVGVGIADVELDCPDEDEDDEDEDDEDEAPSSRGFSIIMSLSVYVTTVPFARDTEMPSRTDIYEAPTATDAVLIEFPAIAVPLESS